MRNRGRHFSVHFGAKSEQQRLLVRERHAVRLLRVAFDFRDESATRRDAMRDLSGYAFDSTYIENEVAYHVKFLATIDSVLVPAAKNKDLKNLLTSVRPAVAAHLAHAEQVRANVRSKK